MNRDFDAWNEVKKKIDSKEPGLFFKEREVWWTNIGLNVGIEIYGKGSQYARPVIIIKKYNKCSFLAVPISTSQRINMYRIPVGKVYGKEAIALISQIRCVDSRRLIKKIGYLDRTVFDLVKKKINQTNFG